MTAWPAAPVGLLAPPPDRAVEAWVDELHAAIDANDVPRLEAAQAVFRLPQQSWPDAPGGAPAAAPVLQRMSGPVEQPDVVPDPEPAALAAPSAGPLRGAWARRAARR